MTAHHQDLIGSAEDLVSWQAEQLSSLSRGLPDGVTADDLKAAGHKALTRAASTFDEDKGSPWRAHALHHVKGAMEGVIREARKGGTRAVRAYSQVGTHGGPDPADVASKAVALREAMFGAIRESDVSEVVKQVVSKAKGGDLKAARLFFDLLSPGRSGVTVTQQNAVVIQRED